MKYLLIFISAFSLSITNAQVSDFKTTDFTIADNVAKLNEGRSLDNLPLLAHHLTYKLSTDAEKFRAIYTWVCTNIKGDYKQDDIVSKQREKFKNDSLGYIKWNNQYKKIAFKKLVKHKKTMCTGYAYLIKELCFIANIECEIINGYGRSVSSNVKELEMKNHSWNAVKLNNKWYLCDATWSSGYMIDNLFISDYNEGYFLTDPILFEKNHYPIHKKWLLNDTLIQGEFVSTPIVYNETFTYKIIPIYPQEMNVSTTRNSEINFSFKSLKNSKDYKVSLIKYSGFKEETYKIYDLKNENGLIQFKSKFKYKGYHDVHIKINDDVVATYTVFVSKS